MKPHDRRHPASLGPLHHFGDFPDQLHASHTRAPISGCIDDQPRDTPQAIFGVLRHAFVETCLSQLEKLKPAGETTTH